MEISSLSFNNNLSPLNKTYKKIENRNTESKIEPTKTSESNEDNKLEKTITNMAKEDAANGVYMGPEFAAFEREYVHQVSPNRSLAIAKVSNLMINNKGYDLFDGINRWISELLDLPYTSKIESRSSGMDNAQVYDQSGEMIASYNWSSGWTSVPTSAENARYDTLTFAYYDAYCNAREAMKARNISNATAVPGTLLNSKA